MPRGTSKYKTEWEQEIDISGEKMSKWMSKINDKVNCDLCNKEIYVGTLGITALKRHAEQKKHKKNVESMTSSSSHSDPSASISTSLPSTQTESRVDNPTLTEQMRIAEAMWSSLVAEHDIAFLMSDHASKIFAKMFTDSAIAAGFKCCRTKTNYMLSDGIAVNVQEKLIQSLQKVPFSLMIDESNKQYGKKFLSVMVKFHDDTYNDVTVRFLDICVCNVGTSNYITNHVDIIRKNNLCFDNLIHIMTDNPNVMRGLYSGVVTQIKLNHASHMVDIGGCSLHHISNAVKNSLPELYLCNEIEDFLQDVSAFFFISHRIL